jgi:hypothetical protein
MFCLDDEVIIQKQNSAYLMGQHPGLVHIRSLNRIELVLLAIVNVLKLLSAVAAG